ncbi:MAG: hypothetical protein RBR35_18085 [Salinivirgaceae bacterium]|nr:hypothetical protein [Salinivirgaceae bacterium]
MVNEIDKFAIGIGAVSLKEKLNTTKHAPLFKRNNYFNLDGTFLIIKISRSERPFWGLGQDFLEFFNLLTENAKPYYFVALTSEKEGWFLSKQELINQISDGSLSYSPNSKQYKINPYNLNDQCSFTSPQIFLAKIEAER